MPGSGAVRRRSLPFVAARSPTNSRYGYDVAGSRPGGAGGHAADVEGVPIGVAVLARAAGGDVAADGSVSNKSKLIDAADQGALDGFKVDRDGNLWCGWGSNGALQAEPTLVGGRHVYQLRGKSEDLDGVMVFNAKGKPLAFLRLPERCANLTFGGPKNNRLYMASCHSLYAMYFETQGSDSARPRE